MSAQSSGSETRQEFRLQLNLPVAKLAKSFGSDQPIAESLGDFRYGPYLKLELQAKY